MWEDLTTVVLAGFDVAPMGALRAKPKQKAALTQLTAADGLFQCAALAAFRARRTLRAPQMV